MTPDFLLIEKIEVEWVLTSRVITFGPIVQEHLE